MTTSTHTLHRHDVRTAISADVPRIARLLARAFADDPVVAWAIPGPRRRRQRSGRAFAAITELYLPKGHVYADAQLRCAALWAPPGSTQVTPGQILRVLTGLAAAYRGRLPLVLSGLVRVQRRQPSEPYWYLAYLGTDPDHQGLGLAGAVLAPVLDRCDREGLAAYLEASKPELIPFYERHGFVIVQRIDLPAGPPVWAMRREPRPSVATPRR